jgi:5-methylcytosine-specific restriction endonuclease McrA
MTRKRPTEKLKKLVRERAQGYCEYCLCRESYATERFSIEHIIALAAGGHNSADNLALACQGCNGAKYDKIFAPDPVTEEIVSLYHPRRDNWHEHFTWNSDHTLLFGLSSTGRATIEALHPNREGVINLRQAMALAGKHPPVHRS